MTCASSRALSGNDAATQLIATALQQQGFLPQTAMRGIGGIGAGFNQTAQEAAWQVGSPYRRRACSAERCGVVCSEQMFVTHGCSCFLSLGMHRDLGRTREMTCRHYLLYAQLPCKTRSISQHCP